jgi:hypothetical protein
MKTNLILIMFLLIFTACKKKELPPPAPVVEKPKLSQDSFVHNLVNLTEVKGLKSGDSIVMPINTSKVGTLATSLTIVALKEDCSYHYLKSVLKKVPLNAVWIAKDGSRLTIDNYNDLVTNYKPGEKFRILTPKPKLVKINGQVYWLAESGKFWKSW